MLLLVVLILQCCAFCYRLTLRSIGGFMSTHNVDWEKLRTCCQNLFAAKGITTDNAFVIADNLVDADLCGVESHGSSRMANYLKRIERGVFSTKFEMKVEQEHAASLALNACNSFGMLAGKYAMDRSIEKAKESGVCFTTVNNSNHYGMAAYYLNIAAKANMIGMTGTNASPTMTPWGSFKPYFGTNPIAISIPTHGEPIVLDMANSVVAMGKIGLAESLGKDIPEGWALDKDGNSTTNPTEARSGTLLPLGGPKGSGLALCIEVLSAILSGSNTSSQMGLLWADFENPQNVGHFFVALDVSKFVDLGHFKDRIEKMKGEIKSLPKTPGTESIFMPGEIEQQRKKDRKANGIELSDVTYKDLQGLCEKHSVPFDL
jgi:LDH2 family malate/lactate/ureidoglycolate dehydrogenase